MRKRKAHRPEPPSALKERFYYNRDCLDNFLQQMCPRSLCRFPDASAFNFRNALSDDGSRQYTALKIGLVWPVDLARRAQGTAPEKLFVVDKGAYDSDAPELLVYTQRGCLQQSIVEADGFMPTGLFVNFFRIEGGQIVKPKLKDPLVMALIQYIFIIQGTRRYYFYPTSHDASTKAQLATLAEALGRAAFGTKSHGAHPTMTLNHTAGSACSDPRVPRAFGIDPRLATMPFTVTLPHRTSTLDANIFKRGRADSLMSHNVWPHGFSRDPQVVAKDIVLHNATAGDTVTADSTTDKSTLHECAPGVEQSGSKPCLNTQAWQ